MGHVNDEHEHVAQRRRGDPGTCHSRKLLRGRVQSMAATTCARRPVRSGNHGVVRRARCRSLRRGPSKRRGSRPAILRPGLYADRRQRGICEASLADRRCRLRANFRSRSNRGLQCLDLALPCWAPDLDRRGGDHQPDRVWRFAVNGWRAAPDISRASAGSRRDAPSCRIGRVLWFPLQFVAAVACRPL